MKRLAATASVLFLEILLCPTGFGQAGQAQLEQSRQFQNERSLSADNPAGPQKLRTPAANFSDAGEQLILKETRPSAHFEAYSDVSAFHATNAAFSRRDAKSDSYLVPDVGISYRSSLSPTLTADFALQETLFRYSRFRELDFDSSTVKLGLNWRPKHFWDVELTGQYSFNRLTTSWFNNEVFRTHSFTLGWQKTVRLSAMVSFFAGGTAQFNVSNPIDLQRQELRLYAGVGVQLTERLSADLSYTGASYFYHDNRVDLNQALDAGLHFRVCEWLKLNGVVSADFNRSNQTSFNYDAVNLGGGINANLSF